jgi:hypothetical protein
MLSVQESTWEEFKWVSTIPFIVQSAGVAFDVALVDRIEAIAIAQLIPFRRVGIVGCPDSNQTQAGFGFHRDPHTGSTSSRD